MRTAHLETDKGNKECSHNNCNLVFKTKKQKLMHHEKLESECNGERNKLLNLITKFKQTFKQLVKENDLSVEDLEKHKEYTLLVDEYEELKENVLDRENFDSVVGKTLDL